MLNRHRVKTLEEANQTLANARDNWRDSAERAQQDNAILRAELSAAKREVERLDRANERLWGRFEAEQRRMAELNLQAIGESLKPTLPPEDGEENDKAFEEYERLRAQIEREQEPGCVVASKEDAPEHTVWFGGVEPAEKKEEVTADA